jgi:hypothetical protein
MGDFELYREWKKCQNNTDRECLENKIKKCGTNEMKKILLTPLDTLQINDLLIKYQDLFKKKFDFRGTFPCDFYTLSSQNLDIKKRYTAYILNLDQHTENGSHWVCIFINTNKKQIEYFDSEGKKYNNKYINNFLNILKKKYNFDIVYNKRQFQFSGVQCGFYCVYYIIQRLLGMSFQTITQTPLTDNDIILFRYTHTTHTTHTQTNF